MAETSSRWTTAPAAEARRLLASLEADLAHQGAVMAVAVPGRSSAHVTVRPYPFVGCLVAFVTRGVSGDPDVAVSWDGTNSVQRTVRLEIDGDRLRFHVQARQRPGPVARPVSSLDRQTGLEMFVSAWAKGLAAVVGGNRPAARQRPEELQRLPARPLRNVAPVTSSRHLPVTPDALWPLLTADVLGDNATAARWHPTPGGPSAGDLRILIGVVDDVTGVQLERYKTVNPRRGYTLESLNEASVVRRDTLMEPSGAGTLLTLTWQCRNSASLDFPQMMDALFDGLEQRLAQRG